ncbi:MAG: sulfotransferase, partial [Deltaproteobacteria bacterium]|nr:sulfotransferase [Deltaproteobacteria bacterium]
MSESRSPGPIAFVLGAPRSGTTLLRVMLAGHPRLFSPPEMVMAIFETMAEREAHMARRFWEKGGLRRALMELMSIDVERAKEVEASWKDLSIPDAYAKLQEMLGGRTLVDKCPHLAISLDYMNRVARWFPEARYLWIIRHPASVLRSVENMPMAEVMLSGYESDSDIWTAGNRNIAQFLETIPKDRWTMVRYEDIVAKDARPVMERACAALGVEFDEKVLDPYEGDRMREGPPGARAIGDPNMAGRGKIEPELATAWLDGFDKRKMTEDSKAFALSLGYDVESLPLPPITKVTEGIAALWKTAAELESSIDIPMDLDAVEGRRFLLRMVHASVDTFVEQGDPDHPTFHHAEGPSRKMFADCPDTDYLRASIRTGEGRVYRISGRIPRETLYAGIVLYGKGGRVGNRIHDSALEIDDLGRFSCRISTDPPPETGRAGVWLKADGDEAALIVRQYFGDRTKEEPIDVSIELEGAPIPAKPLDARDLSAALEKARRMLGATFKRTYDAYKMASSMALNRFVEIPGDQLFPTPDNRYQVCWYRFGRDQTMLVKGKLPSARYFSLCLYNAWMESLDYTTHTIHLNHRTMQSDEHGNFEVCLAHR